MTSLRISGDLRETSFASAVGMIARARATGVLEINDAIGTSRAFFSQGVPQGAKLVRLKNPLGRILVDEQLVSQAQLDQALAIHNKTDKLLGQVLMELGLLDQAALDKAMAIQSRLNLLSLFGAKDGRIEFQDGLVHLTDFIPAAISPLLALYTGVRDHAREEVTYPLLAKLAFEAVALGESAKTLAAELPPAEQMAMRLLEVLRFTGDLARGVPLPPKSLGALLFALNELGGLQIAAAINVPRG